MFPSVALGTIAADSRCGCCRTGRRSARSGQRGSATRRPLRLRLGRRAGVVVVAYADDRERQDRRHGEKGSGEHGPAAPAGMRCAGTAHSARRARPLARARRPEHACRPGVLARPELCEAPLELGAERGHAREAVGRILGERLLDRRLDPARHVGPVEADRRRGGVDVLHRHRDEVVARERHVAGEQLIDDDPERVDVRGLGDLPSLRLLGRDVVAGSEHRARGGLALLRLERAGDPEVGHLRFALAVQQHVLGLDVAVDEALLVGEREPAGDLDRELERALHRQGADTADELLQILAGDELEDDERQAVMVSTVDHGDDVLVREAGDELRLAPEPVDDVLLGQQPLVEDLQRDVALEHAVVRAVHARHAAGPDELTQLVPIRDDVAGHQGRVTPGPKLRRVRRRAPLPMRRALPRALRRRSRAERERGCSSRGHRT